jgi:hypothetical protein
MKLPFKGAKGAPEAAPVSDSAGDGAVQARGAYEVDGEHRYCCLGLCLAVSHGDM